MKKGNLKHTTAASFILLVAFLCVTPWITSPLALASGIIIALVLGNPWSSHTKSITPHLLSYSVVGLGAGMNLNVIAQVGVQGFGYTLVGITLTLVLGFWLGKKLHTDKESTILIAVGTAICGGSAIAAAAPIIRAKPQSISIALGTVFVLNAIALALFPWIGHQLDLTEMQFGLWSALAIHDTSSVVGSTLAYGPEALQVGTTVKLARALWIIPVSVALSVWVAGSNPESSNTHQIGAIKKPWFILWFFLAAALVTSFPELRPLGQQVQSLARKGLVLTLFLIGLNLTLTTLREVGPKPFALGVLLWIIISVTTLFVVIEGWIAPLAL